MNLDQIKDLLLKGEFSSLSITCNNQNSSYETVAKALENENWFSDEDFVPGEKEKCVATNTIWTLQYYPSTPVGFCLIHASTWQAIADHVMKETSP
jgi:hypothetical protein